MWNLCCTTASSEGFCRGGGAFETFVLPLGWTKRVFIIGLFLDATCDRLKLVFNGGQRRQRMIGWSSQREFDWQEVGGANRDRDHNYINEVESTFCFYTSKDSVVFGQNHEKWKVCFSFWLFVINKYLFVLIWSLWNSFISKKETLFVSHYGLMRQKVSKKTKIQQDSFLFWVLTENKTPKCLCWTLTSVFRKGFHFLTFHLRCFVYASVVFKNKFKKCICFKKQTQKTT